MKKLFFLGLSLIALNASAQSVAINTDGSTADASALLDLKSTNQGVLVPRMTAAQRGLIVSPATGLMVYQTDAPAGYYFYNGSTWRDFNGIDGQGIPTGGTSGQLLAKVDNTDFNTEWITPTSTASSTMPASYKGVVLEVTNDRNKVFSPGLSVITSGGSIEFTNVITAPPSTVGTFQPFNSSVSNVPGKRFTVDSKNGIAVGNTPGSAFTALEAGYYSIQVNTVSEAGSTASNTPSIVPFIEINTPDGLHKRCVLGTQALVGTASSAPTARTRGHVSAVVKLEVGEYVGIFVHNLNPSVTGQLSTNGSTKWTIVKL